MRNETLLRYGTHDRASFTFGEAGRKPNIRWENVSSQARDFLQHATRTSRTKHCGSRPATEMGLLQTVGRAYVKRKTTVQSVRARTTNVKAYRAKGIGILNFTMTPDEVMKVSVCSSIAHDDYCSV